MTVYIKKTSIISILILAFILVGCTASLVVEEPVQVTVPPTATAVPTEMLETTVPTPTPSKTNFWRIVTATITPTPTITPERPISYYSNWESLEAGEYIAFGKGGFGNRAGIDVLSLSTMQISHLSELYGFPLTSNGRYIELYENSLEKLGIEELDNRIAVLDLWKSRIVIISSPENCGDCRWYAVDNSLENFLGAGRIEDESGATPSVIKILNVNSETCAILTPHYEMHNYYDFLTWSPDGNWVAFNELQSMWPREIVDDGLYIMPAVCLEDPDTCDLVMKGPYKVPYTMSSFPTWSKDSRFLAILEVSVETSEKSTISIFNLATRSVTGTWFLNVPNAEMNHMHWLGNGDLIASVHYDDGSYGIIQYRMNTNQEEVLATGLEGPVLFTFTKE